MSIQKKIEEFFWDRPVKRFGKGQPILQPGDEVSKVHYLEEGIVNQYSISPTGNIVIVNIFKPGTFFPMSCILNEKPVEYFFEAGSPVSIKQAPAAQIVEFMKEHPDVTFDLLKRVYIGTDGMLKRMTQLMGGSAKTRLMYELLNASYRFGETDSKGATYISLTESDIAQRSGMSRETVNRMMRELKSSGLVRVVRKGIEIPALSKLEELFEEEM